jgi:hypothetical protein
MLDRLSEFNFFGGTDYSSGAVRVIDADLLWLIFTVVFLLYGLLTLVFAYHWHRYEIPGSWTFVGEIVYFVGSLALIMLAAMAIAAF